MSQIQTISKTGSTNVDMLALAEQGAPEGLWLRAERQSSGKGRMGREWASPVGNLYASGLIRLHPTDPPAPTLAFVAAVALVQQLRSDAPNIPFQIKWPNDVMVDGAKLSGILLERAGEAVVVGIGVNLASHPALPDRKTTSLSALTEQAHDPKAFMDGLANAVEQTVSLWRDEGIGAILRQWESHAHPIGTLLSVTLPGGMKVDGIFDGLSVDAALRLRLPDGMIQIVHAGDVFLL